MNPIIIDAIATIVTTLIVDTLNNL